MDEVHRVKCKTCVHHCKECDDIYDEEVRVHKEKNVRDNMTTHFLKDTLCWCCKKAIIGGCSWTDKRQPVPHWDAEPNNRKLYTSYHVNSCPEFERG